MTPCHCVCVCGGGSPDVSKECIAFTFGVKCSIDVKGLTVPRNVGNHNQRHGVTSQKPRILRITVARTLNLEFFYVFYNYLLYRHLQPLIKCRKRSKAYFFLLQTAKCNACEFEHLSFNDRHDLWEHHFKLQSFHKRNLMTQCCKVSIK
jgi:hypothetical protein